MNPKKVYVSSTFADLVKFREKVLERLRRSGSLVVAMEDYAAFDERPAEKCLSDVERCQIYVGILAKRYGYIPQEDNPEGLSISELEYRKAGEAGLPRLMFQLDPKAPWLDEYNDRLTGEGDAGAKILAFRDAVTKRHGIRWFREPEELAGLVLEAILCEGQHDPLPGPDDRAHGLRQADARLTELNASLEEARNELARWEHALIYEDDPERRTVYRARIDRLRTLWDEFRAEHERLDAAVGSKAPQAEAAAKTLRHMAEALEGIPAAERQAGIGLALSGGGFRATLYHLGGLWRMNDLGLLSRLDEISSVSAGSIAAAVLGIHWRELTFDSNGVATNFADAIVPRVGDVCRSTFDAPSVVSGWLGPGRAGDALVRRFRDHLFGDATLQDLPDKPRITIYATSLQTGSGVRFSKPYLADYHLGLVRTPSLPLALVVGASCAAPPFLCPVILSMDPDAWERTEGADLFPDARYRSKVALADGGLYDDMALERIWERYQTVLVSDGGMPFERASGLAFQFTRSLARTLEIVSDRTRSLRKAKLLKDYRSGQMGGAYWGIGMSLGDYGAEDRRPMTRDTDLTRSLSKLRTRFARFSADEQGHLINWGYACADAALRCFVCPSAPPPAGWPVPEYPL